MIEPKPEEVRVALTGSQKATKYEVVPRLVATRFPELASLMPREPKVPTPWLTSRERYWLHMFDALALATASGMQTNRPLGMPPARASKPR